MRGLPSLSVETTSPNSTSVAANVPSSPSYAPGLVPALMVMVGMSFLVSLWSGRCAVVVDRSGCVVGRPHLRRRRDDLGLPQRPLQRVALEGRLQPPPLVHVRVVGD